MKSALPPKNKALDWTHPIYKAPHWFVIIDQRLLNIYLWEDKYFGYSRSHSRYFDKNRYYHEVSHKYVFYKGYFYDQGQEKLKPGLFLNVWSHVPLKRRKSRSNRIKNGATK